MNEMKRKHAMMVFGVVVSMFFLQVSCAGMKERGVEEAPAAVELTEEEAGLLIGTHKLAGVSCSDCHVESPPADTVSEATCLTCHEDYKELTAGTYEDPHNAHIAFPDCGNCHHIHKESENQCLACHSF
jgi:hypothetical protein